MRLQKFTFRQVHESSRKHITRRPYLLPIFGLILGIAMVAGVVYAKGGTPAFRPSDSHVVFVFDSGQTQTVDTKAATVGQLIEKMPLHLIPQDVVEPTLNTPIVEDNFRVNVYRARPVTIVDGSTKTVTLTAQKSARVIAQDAGLKINPEDLASFQEGDLKNNVIGEQVVVSRATPITLNLYGSQVPTYTQAKTVGSMLDEKHIKLQNGETVSPTSKTPIAPGMQVFVLAKGSQVVTTEEAIPAPLQVVEDASLSFGTSVVRQVGAPGKQAVVYLITKNDKGAETSRKLIQQAIIQAPVPQIVARGTTIDINGDKTSIMSAAGISSSDYAYANFIISHESGWRPTAANASGAYGLCQALPGSKMATAGADWSTNPITQLRWCSSYADRSYGGWAPAYNHWLAYRSW
ncbi:MAG TPA: G5 domain-containing protein [Candidatus Saccharimonadales bacterium]|nr:G5 domain-containing protein [Candidatus Saccharimonadales bacterium]